ncbi:DNA-processing protein DprA [Schnuerera sp. xch1]|uniref:DNA-processing protein DprA n=1 Tax=Schnuerera sp. xch1 TaxID=2874283 RepID=UPI001CBB14AA|nr:DNA-processing protein DprA [Schnuerera sp. xch1]
MRDISNRDVLIWLNSINIGNKNIDKIMNQVSQLSDLWNSSSDKIYNLKGIKQKIKEEIISKRKDDYLKRLFDAIEKHNIDVTTVLDENYPMGLHYIYDKPKVIYINGNIIEKDNIGIAIVGSRKATSYGKWATEKFVKELVKLDVTIVSGLALGIDSVAHKAALREGGRTIAILGNGLDVIYPMKNKKIYEEIPKNGALISEYFFGMPPLAYNFPQRNRIISGLSLGVVVIEAKKKSGSLITAQHALEQGKEVFALPGNINSIFSEGTNQLIKDGAKLIMEIDDIIEEIYQLQEKTKIKKEENIDYSQLSTLEKQVFELIKEKPIHCDSIAANTGIDISTINSILTILELKGMIKEMTGRIFTLS